MSADLVGDLAMWKGLKGVRMHLTAEIKGQDTGLGMKVEGEGEGGG